MATLENVRVRNGDPGIENSHHYIESTQGYLKSSHRFCDNTYEIHDYYVYGVYRGQGFGKELLHVALEQAKVLGARAVTASNIITRESVDAISSVFGSDNLTIEVLGEYAPEGEEPRNSAKASMVFEIPEDAADDARYKQVLDEGSRINPTIQAFNTDIMMLNGWIHFLEESSEGHVWRLDDTNQANFTAFHSLRGLLLQEREATWRRVDESNERQ
jgi:hypothetical protein